MPRVITDIDHYKRNGRKVLVDGEDYIPSLPITPSIVETKDTSLLVIEKNLGEIYKSVDHLTIATKALDVGLSVSLETLNQSIKTIDKEVVKIEPITSEEWVFEIQYNEEKRPISFRAKKLS